MRRSYYTFFILVPISLLIILSGCKKDEAPTAPQNHLPKIEILTANPATVLISTETTLTCTATDEDGDNLTITWSSKRGVFASGVVGVSVRWVAPSTAGKDTITATVNDGKQSIQGKLEIIVGTIPTGPTLLTPTNNAIEVSLSPTLTWNVVSNSTGYTLQVSANNSFSSFVFNQNGLTNTSQQITGLNISTIYYWRVNSTNIYGTSSWSNVFTFNTVTPPQQPTLLAPANNAINISITPTLSWNAIANATSYTLQVSTTNSFLNFIYNQNIVSNTSQQISGLSKLTQYYWRLSATNAYGTSSWSNTSTFNTMETLPSTPSLSSPINDAIDIQINPTLTWDSSSQATTYTVQLSTVFDFSTIVYSKDQITTTSLSNLGLSNSTKYYWRVKATNGFGSSSWSQIRNFTTILPTPIACPGIPTITYAGKIYNTVQIGTQCWMKENLDVGTIIDVNQWQINNGVIEKYCYNNNPNNCTTYGGLYQWNEAMQYVTTEGAKGICPVGWHIPTKAEFATLAESVINNPNALKAIGQGVGTNTSGFSALLAGLRYYITGTNGSFDNLGTGAYFWGSTALNSEANILLLGIYGSEIDVNRDHNLVYGYSVRCLKN